jgi:hypothetical protein
MPAEIKHLIISFAIEGLISHIDLLFDIIKVVTDTTTIKLLLSVSRQTKSTLEKCPLLLHSPRQVMAHQSPRDCASSRSRHFRLDLEAARELHLSRQRLHSR